MTFSLLDKAPYVPWVIILGILLRFIYRLIRPWIKTREERAKTTAKLKREAATFFSAFVFVCGVAFAALVLLAVALPQWSPARPIVSLLAAGSIALGLIGLLLLVFGVPAYNHVMELADRVSQNLKDQNQHLDHLNQLLEYRYRSLEVRYLKLEDRYLKLEERMRGIDLQGPARDRHFEKQFPLQRNLAFMEMWSVPKPDAELKRLTGSSQR